MRVDLFANRSLLFNYKFLDELGMSLPYRKMVAIFFYNLIDVYTISLNSLRNSPTQCYFFHFVYLLFCFVISEIRNEKKQGARLSIL